MKHKAVVIGCGFIGARYSDAPGVHSHAQAYSIHPSMELAGLCDLDPTVLKTATGHWKVNGSTDALELCKSIMPQVVSICTPDAAHFQTAKRIVVGVRPAVLIMEKPIAMTIAEAEELLGLAQQHGVNVLVNYSRRFSPAFQYLKNALQDGEYGKPLRVFIRYGKGLFHNGTHAIDLLRLLLREPAQAKGFAKTWGPEGDDSYSAMIEFKNGTSVILEAFDERVCTVFECDFIAEKRRFAFELGGQKWRFYRNQQSTVFPGYRNYIQLQESEIDPVFSEPLAKNLYWLVDNAVNVLEKNAPLICSGDDALQALRWAQAIKDSYEDSCAGR
ncbi:MAG: Gfo/Idh/MocA family oxidoreductase [Fibrobacterota bacterium]